MSLDVIRVMLLPVIVDRLEEGKLCSSPPETGFIRSITSSKVSGPLFPGIMGSLSSLRRHLPRRGDPLLRLQTPQEGGRWWSTTWIPSLFPPLATTPDPLVAPPKLCSALAGDEERCLWAWLDHNQPEEAVHPDRNTKEKSRDNPVEAQLKESRSS